MGSGDDEGAADRAQPRAVLALRVQVGLLLATLALAVALSVGMWAVGVVPFNAYTSALHVVSIYIGVSGVLLVQRRRDARR